MSDLFEASGIHPPDAPLADRLRPATLDEVVGQDHLLGEGGPIRRMTAAGRLGSMILWGPPGTGKTTIARLLAKAAGYEYMQISAVFSGVADLKKAFEQAKAIRASGRSVLLFVDEIHRFNRTQQDSFLPFVEAGVVTLVGATTENPSFELNGALLSRSQVYVLKRLDDAAMAQLLVRAETYAGKPLPLLPEAREALFTMADGEQLDVQAMASILQKRAPAYDKSREEHYNLISALHKSVRGSDPDAALYWLARMLKGGEDPLFIARRLVRMAVEDIGEADPLSILVANAAKDTYDFLGSPEGELALAQCTVHLATAPKSIGVYQAYKAAMKAASETGSLMPPANIRNAPTKLMKELGYGKGYNYDPDTPEGFSGDNFFPDGMPRQSFYRPKGEGHEEKVKQRMERWAQMRARNQAQKAGSAEDDDDWGRQ